MIFVADLRNQCVDPLYYVGGRFAAGTALRPDIPLLWQTLLFTLLTDLRGGDAFVVAVVPLCDLRGDSDAGVRAGRSRGEMFLVLGGGLPRERIVAADVKEFEGALGTGTRGDVALHLR